MNPGDLVDRYRIVAKLGEGGFGDVYSAEQIDPIRREIALKVMRHDPSTRGMLGRFESEQQALALMAHRHIAEFYDAGVSEQGLPYFVMELVQGSTLNDYCDSERLGPRARLRLFLQVCEAVEHAHQKGIIHRDLKPSNILVRREGDEAVVKVIDFGIAKALSQPLTDRSRGTQPGRPIGTPAYMSPEQVDGAMDIDVRTDIYALGVVLYELLTGFVPLELPEIGYEMIVRDKEPARPSTRVSKLRGDSQESAAIAENRGTPAPALARLLRGDLDLVVMTCLEKDRQRRYGSAKELADEVRRYLDGLPLRSRRPSTSYRLRKFVTRHQTGVMFAAAAAIFLALAGVNFYQSRMVGARVQAYEDRERAEQLFEQARAEVLFDQEAAIELLREAFVRAPEYLPVKVRYCLELARRGSREDLAGAQEAAMHGRADAVSEPIGRIDDVLVILDHMDDFDGASRALERMRLPEYLVNYALAFVATDKHLRVRLLSTAVESNPWDFDVLWARAVACFYAEDFEQMKSDAQLLQKRDLDSPYAYVLEGAASQELGDPTQAIALYELALKHYEAWGVEPGWKLYHNLAHSRRMQGDFEGGLRDGLHALDLCEEILFQPVIEVMRCELELGNLEQARRRLEQAKRAVDFSASDEQREHLSAALRRLNMFQEAAEVSAAHQRSSRIKALLEGAWSDLLRDECSGAREQIDQIAHVAEIDEMEQFVANRYVYVRGFVRWYCDDDLRGAAEDFAYCSEHNSEWDHLFAWAMREGMGDIEADQVLKDCIESVDEAANVEGVGPEQLAELGLVKLCAKLLLGDPETMADVEKMAEDTRSPHHGFANFYLGLWFHAKQGAEAARPYFSRADDLEPDHIAALWLRKGLQGT